MMDFIDLIFNTNLILHPFLEKHYFVMLYHLLQSFPGDPVVKNLPAVQVMQEMSIQSLGQEDPLEEEMATYSSIVAWRSPMDRGAWWATVHGVTESWVQLKRLSTAHRPGVHNKLNFSSK